jgi:pyruvate kinase
VLTCKAVLGFTKTGSTVRRIARERPPCVILGLTPDRQVANRMALTWGVQPIVTQDPKSFDDMLETTQEIAKRHAQCIAGDTIIISAGIPFGRPGTTDTLKIATID